MFGEKDEVIEYIIEGEEVQGGAQAEPETTIVGDGAVESDPAEESTTENETNEATSDDPDEDDIHADASDEEREAIRERRRKERQERKQRTREREDTLRRELAAQNETIARMTQQLNEIQRRNSSGDIAKIADAKRQVVTSYEQSKIDVQVATEKGDGRAVAEATERMIKARDSFNELDRIEKAYKQTATRQPPLDDRMVNYAKDWMERNKWYNPQAKDADSKIVLAIDQSLAEEGYNSSTPDYWDELSNRVKKYLPHRANRAIIPNKQRSVVGSSSRDTPRSSGSNTGAFKLSAERVKAIKDMGAWDDPKARNEMIKQYRDYDRANKGA